jgi:hypothetical protein
MADTYHELTTLDEHLAAAIAASQSNTNDLLSIRVQVQALREAVKPKPVPGAAIISRTELRNVRGFCITLGEESPSAEVDAVAVKLIELGASMGYNVVRFYRNKDEVRDDVKRRADDPRHLYAVAHRHGLVVAADTINRAALEFSDADLKAYLAGLETLGAKLLVFDDANQYREKRKDGTYYPANTLEDMVARVRKFSGLPILASVRANAVIAQYRPLFDFVEFQTFGTAPELDTFLQRPADAFVLDTSATASLAYLNKVHATVLKRQPVATFDYSAWDEKINWLDVPDKVAVIKKRVQAVKAQQEAAGK